jgi:DNA-binding XRE family transcriptional regulator
LGYVNNNIKAARKLAGLTQEDVAKKLNVPRSTYGTWETVIQPSWDDTAAIGKVLGFKVNDLLDEDFISKNNIENTESEYKKRKRAGVKSVDADQLLSHTVIEMKAMMRVMLRNQAEIISKQKGVSVSSVLKQLTKAVRDEASEEFDEL